MSNDRQKGGFNKAMQIVNSLPQVQQTLLIQCSMSTNSTPRQPIVRDSAATVSLSLPSAGTK